MYSDFFEPDVPYVGYFKFPKDPQMVPGHLIIKKNVIEGQLYRAPSDLIKDPRLPLGFGFKNVSKLDATGTFRLRGGKDRQVSIFGIRFDAYRSSELTFFEIVCNSLIVKGNFEDQKTIFPQKLILKFNGLDSWFNKNTVRFEMKEDEIAIFSGSRVEDLIYSSKDFSIALEAYANYSIDRVNNFVKEIKALVITFHENTNLVSAKGLVENIRQIFSLFFMKQLGIDSFSFLLPDDKIEYFFIFSDYKDYHSKRITSSIEAVVKYSDVDVFKIIISNFLSQRKPVNGMIKAYSLIGLNNSLYNENAFLTWVFELDAYVKKTKQVKVSSKEAMNGFSEDLIAKLDSKDDPLIKELFGKWQELLSEKLNFYSENLQSRLIRNFSNRHFFTELISKDPELFFKRVVKTRNQLTHPAKEAGPEVLSESELPIYQYKLHLMIYSLILIELGIEEKFFVNRIKGLPLQKHEPLH